MAYTYLFREMVVEYALEHSIQAAAKHYGLSRNTVRKWYQELAHLWSPPEESDDYIIFEIC